MKITLDLGEDQMGPLIEQHLATGVPAQEYIKSAINYFMHMLKIQNEMDTAKTPQAFGYGDAGRMRQWNTVVDPPSSFLPPTQE